MKITLLLPLPPKQLSPNARVHHFVKAEYTASYRSEIAALTKSKVVASSIAGTWQRFLAQQPRLRLTETYCIAGRRKHDVRNLFAAFKAGEDGLVDAGLLLGDDDSVLEHGPPRIQRVKTKAEQGVWVKIEEVV